MGGSKLIRVQNEVNSFWSHTLSVGEYVTNKITCVHRVLREHVMELEAGGEEGVGQMTRLCVKVTNKDNRVSPPRLLHKLKDFKQLAVTATRISLQR